MLSITLQLRQDDTILFIGGGDVTERRISLVMNEARCVVISPTVTETIRKWAVEGLILWHETPFTDTYIELLKASKLLFISTNNRELNDKLESLAKDYKVWMNRSDKPEACDFTIPATLEVGDLQIAIGANNGGPRINRLVRQDMTNRYSELKIAIPRLKIIREEVKSILPSVAERQQFWRTHLDETAFQAILDGNWPYIEEKLHYAISGIRSKS
ncbi:precorrin-2 dehydrogenase/sirohydrochlorin ferrochelatase family protein [Veillonella agrestimuris]|uniref:precorrin-2 dehydrogenase/sirohydrochlorin ferrochelatase family protein n=1 Tax=Veillonella agrestimuris TaxID=2941340 RepID=UPI00203C29A4|nr:bifunctional precorrin-2 dehydrogenase/sirohydrochlorin ferrochelatase [Veillonella agrestimuris]